MSFLKSRSHPKILKETESTAIENEEKIIDDTKSCINTLMKKLKNSTKTLTSLSDDSSQLHQALNQYAEMYNSENREIPLGTAFQKWESFEKRFNELLNKLTNTINNNVIEKMNILVKEYIPTYQPFKKKFDNVKRDYASSINKVASLQKEKKPNPPKVQQAEQERDKMRDLYITTSEETLSSFVEISENSQLETLERILVYCEAYNQFFNEGQQFFKEFNLDIMNLTKQMNEVKEKFNQKRAKRSKREKNNDAIVRSNSIIQTKTFSIPLEELMDRIDGKTLPDFLQKCISYIKNNGLKVPSIFRTAPPKVNLEDTKKKIEDNTINWNDVNDIHIYTGIIKLFLKELPEPLATFELFDRFKEIPSIENEQERISELKKVIESMPQCNFIVFMNLMNLLYLVEENKEFNKMTSLNLAAVFTPLILYPEEPNPATMVDDIEKSKEVVNIIIKNANTLFNFSKDKKEKKKKRSESKSKKVPKIKTKKNRSLNKKLSIKKNIEDNNSIETESHVDGSSTTQENKIEKTQETDEATSKNTDNPESSDKKTEIAETVVNEGKLDENVDKEEDHLPALPESYTILKDIQFTDDYFVTFEELLDSVYTFSKEATFSDTSKNFQNINDSLKVLAKAAKEFLKSNMSLSSTLPTTVNNIIIESGNNFSKQLLQTASALKNISFSNESQNSTFDIIKDFLISLTGTFNTIREVLLYDEFYLITKDLSLLVDSFLNDNLTVPLNQLKVILLKFKHIATSKSYESENSEMSNCLAKCNDILNYINAQKGESTHLSHLRTTLQHLKHLAISAAINHIRQNKIQIDSNSVTNIVLEQVEQMKQLLEKVNSISFKDIIPQLELAINQVLILLTTVKSTPISNKEDFFNFSFILAKNIGKLSTLLRNILENNKDNNIALNHYTRTLWMFSLYMKISSFSTTYDIINESNNHLNSVTIIKDFVFIVNNMLCVLQEMY